MISAREAALLTLYEVFKNDAYSNLALKERLSKCIGMSAAEKALLTNLVYGVVSRHFTLIHIIKKYSSVKPKKLADYIRIILEMGLYQLIYTDKIPESAAVNESVKLAKRYGRRGSDRFINAVLRSFCRDGCRIEYPKDKLDALAVKHSFSPEMTRLICNDFGTQRADIIMENLNAPPSLMLRANSLKLTTDELVERLSAIGVKSEPCGGTLIKSAGFDIGRTNLYREGCFSVQDRAAYNAAIVLDPKAGETIIDMCAAPGGKTTHIAQLQNDKGRIIACDVHEHKLRLIEESTKRLGIRSIQTRLSDGTKIDNSLVRSADRVLCDVPCSGLGIIRRKPDIKLGRTDISALPAIQLAILENGAKYVKAGGILVYSTCTINKAENSEVTEEFLVNNPEFIKTYEKLYCPDTDDSDGFYICRFERDTDD